jgi:hypothetical protein
MESLPCLFALCLPPYRTSLRRLGGLRPFPPKFVGGAWNIESCRMGGAVYSVGGERWFALAGKSTLDGEDCNVA